MDLPVTDPRQLSHLHPGHRMLIDDGAVGLVVVSADAERVSVRALNSGVISSHKGVNLPDTPLPIPSLTRRDRELLRLAVEAGADHIAQSFVRSAADVRDLRAALGDEWSSVRIVAKIEKREALDRLEEIVAASAQSWWPGATSASRFRPPRSHSGRRRSSPSPGARAVR